MSWLFTSGGQSIGASVSASVLPMAIQGWFPLGILNHTVWFYDAFKHFEFCFVCLLYFLCSMHYYIQSFLLTTIAIHFVFINIMSLIFYLPTCFIKTLFIFSGLFFFFSPVIVLFNFSYVSFLMAPPCLSVLHGKSIFLEWTLTYVC